jgi:hypothetical protein
MSFMIQGTFTSNGAARRIDLPTGCDYFKLVNYTAQGSTANPGVVKTAEWFRGMPDASAFVVKNTNSAATSENSVITTGGFTLYDDGNPPTYPALTVTSITQANPAVVTVTAHGYATGDYVVLTNLTGMQQLSSMLFQITVTGANTFTIPISTSGFASAASGGNARKVASPGLFTPRVVIPTAITAASSAVVSTNIPHNLEVGSKVSFVVAPQFGMTQLSGQVGQVTAVGSATQFTVNINTTGYTAFAYPASGAVPFTFAQVLPIGSQTILTDATYNEGTFGLLLGTAVAGANNDVVYYIAYKANKAAGE